MSLSPPALPSLHHQSELSCISLASSPLAGKSKMQGRFSSFHILRVSFPTPIPLRSDLLCCPGKVHGQSSWSCWGDRTALLLLRPQGELFSCLWHLRAWGKGWGLLCCPGKVQGPLSGELQMERGRVSSIAYYRWQGQGDRYLFHMADEGVWPAISLSQPPVYLAHTSTNRFSYDVLPRPGAGPAFLSVTAAEMEGKLCHLLQAVRG